LVRFVHFFNYAKGVSIKDGEKWYLEEHVPRVRKLPGVVRYLSWRAEEPISLPSPDRYDRFVRRTDLYFKDMDMCLGGTTGNPGLWMASVDGIPGFGEFECLYLEEEPQYDIMRDVPPQQYKYMATPMKISGPAPEFEDSEDVIYDTYFFYYKPEISVVDGEDWYLGHHVREAKILKQVGRRHYKTWKALRIPEKPDSPLHPNRWYRMTELGLSLPVRWWSNAGPEGPRFEMTRPPQGNVWGGWRNIVIKPEPVQDLLT